MGQLGKEGGIFGDDSVITKRGKFDEIWGMHQVLVGKDTAAHSIEHHVGKMVGAVQLVISDLQSIGAGNDFFQVHAVGSHVAFNGLSQALAIFPQIFGQTDDGGAVLADLGYQIPGALLSRSQVEGSMDKISTTLPADFYLGQHFQAGAEMIEL